MGAPRSATESLTLGRAGGCQRRASVRLKVLILNRLIVKEARIKVDPGVWVLLTNDGAIVAMGAGAL